ncbi:helix-turn-helix domain-containing protein [Pedobacter sp. AW1-32]|uniref:helix-turn-helix domain-containing protein n=1 Tax=Pedobacter sp. AW1-32 TaxID=3383026 RepID=UPI003FEFC383
MDERKNKLICKTLQYKRSTLGYSQRDMALKLKISQSTYSKTERNIKAAPVERLIQISIVLNFSISDLLENHLKVLPSSGHRPASKCLHFCMFPAIDTQ